MKEAEIKIEKLEELTGGMDAKVDKLIVEVVRAKILSTLLNLISPIAVGLIVYLLTKGGGH
jgi:hypothetical protein